MKRFKTDGHKCHQGHNHVTLKAVHNCDQDYWARQKFMFPAATKPLKKLVSPEPAPQLEAFPDFVVEK